ncbi:MAG: cytochrome c [Sulfuricellaceae bacterium]|nr:cytochrome c [Sulfuricellaceae bacterium]
MTPSPLLILISLVTALALTGCSEPKDTHPNQPVTKRKAVFKEILRTFEPLGQVVREREDYQPQAFLAGAKELDRLASHPWQFFTPDSNYPPTRAKTEVWDKPQEFKQAQEQFQAKIASLAKVAESGKIELIRPAFDEVEKSCKSCHQQFRGNGKK